MFRDHDTPFILTIIAAITVAIIVVMWSSTASDLWKKKKIKEQTEADMRRFVKELKLEIQKTKKGGGLFSP